MDTTTTVLSFPDMPGPSEGIGQVYVKPLIKGKIRGFASLNYAGVVLKDMRIIEGGQGLFVAPPSTKVGEKWHSPFYFLDKVLKDRVQDAVLSEYTKQKDRL